MYNRLLKVEIKYEQDVVLARQRARQISELIGFETQDQVRIATAVSELARNAYRYVGNGLVEFAINVGSSQELVITVSDKGDGIPELTSILAGTYESKTGMGMGLIGVKRLMDKCTITSNPGEGSIIECVKTLPKHSETITLKDISRITQTLTSQNANSPFEEIQQQNQELLLALTALEYHRAELAQLNSELEETNRGVVALYAELDQRADELKKISELKTQFLSYMTHEFRTPLNSMRSISQMLLDKMDGDLTKEQEKQVGFIKSATIELSSLVNDLLDLAKVEAGKFTVQTTRFSVYDLFSMLRGMLKPLFDHNPDVALFFEADDNLPFIVSDEVKLTQILRNFISNGLKYTKNGQVRVTASRYSDNAIIFCVSDSGIGIAENDQKRIFEEYIQIEGQHQDKTKGTGLGLPLAKRLAELLGGSISFESTLGKGSQFSVILPIQYGDKLETQEIERIANDNSTPCFLLIDDNDTDRYVLRRMLARENLQLIDVGNGELGLDYAASFRPNIIFLDLMMPGTNGYEILNELKTNETTASIPVIIHTSQSLNKEEQQHLSKQAAAIINKGSIEAGALFKLTQSILNNALTGNT